MTSYRVIIFTILSWWWLFGISIFAGHILETHKYAWSNNVGYINFSDVIVEDTALSGYAWSKTHGWIKFDPLNGGVLNNWSGQLSGYAWGESLGWIDFDGVVIDTLTGRFWGTATGTLIGTLTFDCPEYCDVRTDWRPAVPPYVGGEGSSGWSSRITDLSREKPHKLSVPSISATVTALFKKLFREKTVTRLETVLVALKLRGIPMLREYSCHHLYEDIFSVGLPWFTCQAVEKAKTAQMISATNTHFYPLSPVSRIEAYSILMKSICVHPISTDENWKYLVIKKAQELWFTVRTLETFEPDRPLLGSELSIISQYLDEYAQKYMTCPERKK